MITIKPETQLKSPPLELFVCPFVVLESNAEQHPWTFSNIILGNQQIIVRRKRQYMKTADYGIEGFEDRILIERKSPEDLVGSVCGGHARLEAEHERMKAVADAGGFCCLICEGNYAEIDDRLRLEGRDKAAETLLGTAASWPAKFGVNWYFAGDRRHAEVLAFRILWRMWRKLTEVAAKELREQAS